MTAADDSTTLSGVRVLTLAVNVPGPVAAARLAALGAEVVTVQPPWGDPLAAAAPSWYAELHAGIDVRRLDLKTPAGRTALAERLEAADVLLTANRPSALARLGLDAATLQESHPCLVGVEIVGGAGPAADRPGHDLTYVAAGGLLESARPPRTLLADLAGAAAVVEAVLTGLLRRGRTGRGVWTRVSLVSALQTWRAPLVHGLTAPGGALGGGLALYDVYPAAEGFVAVAALEEHFATRLLSELGISEPSREALEQAFATRPAAEWAAWAEELDLPLTAVAAPVSRAALTDALPDAVPGTLA